MDLSARGPIPSVLRIPSLDTPSGRGEKQAEPSGCRAWMSTLYT
jgi:hypothetical protein